MKPPLHELRTKILSLTEEYAREVFEEEKFEPGITHVPVSGKLIGKRRNKFAVDACLDG